jgi:GT2 family glycosyltransferase
MEETRSVVVLVNYNGDEDTRRCAESLASSQPIPGLVVVDNASTSGNVEEAVAGYPGVEVLHSPRNLGIGRGNNLGIRRALSRSDCEFVFVLNNDTKLEPDTIAKLERALKDHPEAGMATPRILLMERPGILWYGGGEIDWRRGSVRVPGYLGPANVGSAFSPRDVGFASGCAMLVRRTVFDQIGGFDPRYFIYEEDVELCLRVREAGWTIRYVPEALVYHKGQASGREKEEPFQPLTSPDNPRLAFNMFQVTKNRLLNMSSHARGAAGLQFLCFFPVFLLKKCAQFALHGRWDGVRAILKGIVAFLSDVRKPRVNELA